MASGSMSIHIDRPAEDVFDCVANVENNPSWRTAVIESEWLDDGPMRPGRVGRQVSKVMGRRYEVTAEVVDWDPPRHVSWATTTGGADVRTHCRVEPDGDGCIVTISSEGAFTGVWKLLTPVAAAMLKRQSRSDAERLRSTLEGDRSNS